jgi:hypothetical protein
MKHTVVAVVTLVGLLCLAGCHASADVDPDRAHDSSSIQLAR